MKTFKKLSMTAALSCSLLLCMAQQPSLIVCASQSFTITTGANPPTGSGTLAYKWYVNDAEVAGQTSATFTAPAGTVVGSYAFKRWVRAGTCTPDISAPTYVLVLPEPATFTVTPPANALSGTNFVFTAPLNANVTYTWSANSGTGSANGNSYTISGAPAGKLLVSATASVNSQCVAGGTTATAIAYLNTSNTGSTMDNFYPDPSAAANTQWTVKDARNNATHTIKKLADGKVWMTTNLTNGASTQTSYYSQTAAFPTGAATLTAAYQRGACPTGWAVPQSVELTSLFSTLKTAGITLETALSCTGGYYDSSTQKENGTCAIWSTRARVPTPWPATITATAPSLAVRCVYVGK